MNRYSDLTIIMYHYVRPIADSHYPYIKGREVKEFEGQLDYLSSHYKILTPLDVLKAINENTPISAKSALLTFDDGYKDHFRYVYPILQKRKLAGVFFPPTAAVSKREILNVNRIHFILASAAKKEEIIRIIENCISDATITYELKSIGEYRKNLAFSSRFDEADTIYIKRLLQHALPKSLREEICRNLFLQFVSKDERSFADDLYVNGDELREMAENGMEIGSHGHDHAWLAHLEPDAQAIDIDTSLCYLASLGLKKEQFWFCYPYGSYNYETTNLLKQRKCAAAVTTEVKVANSLTDFCLELPRLDTNDLPCSS